MHRTVLITGGSGLVGSALSQMLRSDGYSVRWLTRCIRSTVEGVEQYLWDVDKGEIDAKAFHQLDAIIHLAGCNIAEKPWTAARKQEIIDSRCKPLQLLEKQIKELDQKPGCIISASAIGIYPGHDFSAQLDESASLGTGFTAEVCKQWESALLPFNQMGVRTASIRTGLVLSHAGGALPRLITLCKMRIASPIGSGKQAFAWIHSNDLCSVFQFALENEHITGAINAVAPQSTSNAAFMASLSHAMMKRQIMPSVPAIVVRLLFGDRSQMLLEGSNIVPQRLIDQGFVFKYPSCEMALRQILAQH